MILLSNKLHQYFYLQRIKVFHVLIKWSYFDKNVSRSATYFSS